MSVKFVADSINLPEMIFAVVLSGLLSVTLFFIGQWQGKRAERKAIEREQKTHTNQTMMLVREITKLLKAVGLPIKEIDSHEVQDAIQMSAATIIGTWDGPTFGTGGGPTVYTGAGGKISGIIKENVEQKEEDKEGLK